MLGGDTPPAERWPLFLLDDPPASDLDHGLYDGSPDEPPPALTDSERLWSFTPFVGMNDDDRFVEIVTFRGGDFQNSYIAGAALARHFATTFDHLQWEGEVSGYHHWGIQDHWEMNLALVARWTWFPWDRYLDTNVAFGQGVSWASDRPPLERETRQLLNHLVAEVEVIPLRDRPVSLVVRAHHRSGVFGLYGASGGSNFVNLGVRFRF